MTDHSESEFRHSALALAVAATANALTVGEMRTQIHISGNVHDVWLKDALSAATKHVEHVTRRALLSQTWDAKFDRFPAPGEVFELPKPPLVSVSSVKYIDTAGVEQTWSSAEYVVDTDSERGRIWEAFGFQWPDIRLIRHAVTVRFVGGYADAAAVPEDIKHALLMLIAHWFNNREALIVGTISKELEFGVNALLGNYISQRF